METTSIILIVLGIFIGIPAVIALATASMYRVGERRTRRAERIKALELTVAETQSEQPLEARGEAAAKEMTKESVPVT